MITCESIKRFVLSMGEYQRLSVEISPEDEALPMPHIFS
jgi:hypothetical protein